jgi:hypothetical protein
MVLLAIACAIVTATSFALGTLLLSWTNTPLPLRSGDRCVVAVWLGLIVLCATLLGLSLVVRLSHPGLWLVWVPSLVGLFMMRATRQACAVPSRATTLGIALLIAAVATVAASPVTYYDTGFYHFGAIEWLTRFGAIRGLALLQSRFGFPASWLALAAPFNIGPLETHLSALPGAVAFILALLHLAIATARIVTRTGRPADVFVTVAFLLALPIIVRSRMVVSPSPDLPIIILAIVVGWLMLMLFEARGLDAAHDGRGWAIPLALSAGAMTIKTSAAALLIITLIAYLRYARRRAAGLICAASLVAPTAAFGIITSGCPLYPAPLLCVQRGWSAGTENARHVSEVIQLWARWSGPTPPDATAWNWVRPWSRVNPEFVSLLAYSIGGAIILSGLARSLPLPGAAWLSSLAGLGIVLTGYNAPDLRFAIGYLSILPAAFAAAVAGRVPARPGGAYLLGGAFLCGSFGHLHFAYPLLFPAFVVTSWVRTRPHQPATHLRERAPRRTALPAVLVALSIAALATQGAFNTWLRNTIRRDASGARGTGFALLLPPGLPVPVETELMHHRMNDVDYVSPRFGNQCWAAALPCTPSEDMLPLRLRAPASGLRGGFVRATATP